MRFTFTKSIIANQEESAKRRQARRREFVSHFIPATLLFCSLLLQLLLRVEFTGANYQLEQLRRDALESDLKARSLSLEYATATRLQTLSFRAREELELVRPASKHVRRIIHQQEDLRGSKLYAMYDGK